MPGTAASQPAVLPVPRPMTSDRTRTRPQEGPEQAAHHLGRGVVAGVAIDLPLTTNDSPAMPGRPRCSPRRRAPTPRTARIVDPGALRVGRRRGQGIRAPHSDGGVPPGGGGALGQQERARHHGHARSRGRRRPPRPAPIRRDRDHREGGQEEGGRPPAAGGAQQGQQAEPAGQGTRDPAHGVPEVRASEVAGDARATLASSATRSGNCAPATTEAGRTTIAVTIVQPVR